MSPPASRQLSRRAALRRLGTLLLSAAGVALLGRGWGQGDPAPSEARPSDLGARPIAIGEDRCPACNMAVFDARFAAMAISAGGRTLVYDAIECLADHLNGHAGAVPELQHAFLADRSEGSRQEARWLLAEGAVIVHHPALRTPMGGGLAAFHSEAAARSFTAGTHLAEAELLDWPSVLERGAERPWVPPL